MPDPVAVTRAAAILPFSSKPSYCNVPHEPDKTVFPTLSDDADPWAIRRKRKICNALRQTNRQDGASENATHHPATGEADGSVTDIAGWKASLPPYATDLHYQQLNATQLNELIGKGGLWASKARREIARRECE